MWGSDGGLRSFVVINYVIAGTFAAENSRHTLRIKQESKFDFSYYRSSNCDRFEETSFSSELSIPLIQQGYELEGGPFWVFFLAKTETNISSGTNYLLTYGNVSILPGNVASYKAYTEIKPVNLNLSGKYLQTRHVSIAFKIAAIKYGNRFSLGPDVWAPATKPFVGWIQNFNSRPVT